MFPGKGNSLQCCCMTQLLLLLSFPCVHVYVPVLMGKHHQENDKMRIQALKKAGKEREMKIQKESELLRAKKELEALKIKHQKLSDRVQNYSIFGTYLEDVVKVSQVSVGGSHGLREGLTWALNLEKIRYIQENHSIWPSPETSDGMGRGSL